MDGSSFDGPASLISGWNWWMDPSGTGFRACRGVTVCGWSTRVSLAFAFRVNQRWASSLMSCFVFFWWFLWDKGFQVQKVEVETWVSLISPKGKLKQKWPEFLLSKFLAGQEDKKWHYSYPITLLESAPCHFHFPLPLGWIYPEIFYIINWLHVILLNQRIKTHSMTIF